MLRLFSYVVDHDYGFAPNPFGGFCTLAKCKYKKEGQRRRNIVELAKVGDWIIGTGGVKKESSGHRTLLYAMRVDEKLTLAEYYEDKRFRGRNGNTSDESHRTDTYALISQHFYYFGKNAISIDMIPKEHLSHSLEKKGPGFRSNFSAEFIEDFVRWLERNYEIGIHGDPCGYEVRSFTQVRKKNQWDGSLHCDMTRDIRGTTILI
ncbi:MAG: hypothetical protein DRJ03_19480 [Chloroflexi bacterium]|nr:MAG: hypothetical protein DRJ03_19480 [Chloroflexota bacterium]